jgi:site-specific DNA-adenine methylase
MRNHFFFGYAGNKREEVERIFNLLKLSNIKIIIEPFCGTCALSYYISLQSPKKYKYIINDNDKKLIELFKLAQNKKKFDIFIKKINSLCFDKDNNFIDKPTYLKIVKEDNLEGYFISQKFKTIRNGMYPSNRKMTPIKEDCPFVKFLREEDVEILNLGATEVIDKYINKKEAFLFLDPPYLSSCNDFYLNKDVNIYEYIYKIKDSLLTLKSTILLCLEDIWIIRLLFDNLKECFITYDKIYQVSKKKTTHIIIYNRNT